MGKLIIEAEDYKFTDYYHSQRNNKLHPSVTCFPTSVAMPIDYILHIEGKQQSDIGIPNDVQIEDFLTEQMSSKRMIDWMLKYVGAWAKDYTQRSWTVAAVEEKVFDDLMKSLNYEATFKSNVTYEDICEQLEKTQLPQVIFGDFSPIRKQYGYTVQGHINCCVGYIDDNREVIDNDPYGNALTKGYSGDGAGVIYSWDQLFMKDSKKKTGWLLAFDKK